MKPGHVKVNSKPVASEGFNRKIKSQTSSTKLFGAWNFRDFHQTGNFCKISQLHV